MSHPSIYEELPVPLAARDLFWVHRNLGKPPRWEFPTLLQGHGLRCIRMDFENFDQLWPLLAAGNTTFVDERYRDRAKLYQQLLFLRGSAAYSGKHGACDWIMTVADDAPEDPAAFNSWTAEGHIRLRAGTRIVGVLHLYELSHERFDGRQPNPFVGLQLCAENRGKGLGKRALELLEWFVAKEYSKVSGVTANIKRNNERSLRLFRGLGYRENEEYSGREEEVFLSKLISGTV